jgi:hypothetical protein
MQLTTNKAGRMDWVQLDLNPWQVPTGWMLERLLQSTVHW